MDTDIFEQFPDRETFDKYWNENYQPVTYEDVREAFTDFVKSADGHIYLSDYEEKGMISREDFKENLSQEAQFTFEDGLTEVFYDKNPELYETAFCSVMMYVISSRSYLYPNSIALYNEMIEKTSE